MITKELPNDKFLPFVISELHSVKGKTVTIPLRGRSMRPFLEDNRDKALLTITTQPNVGDAVLAEVSPGRFVLHRIVGIDDDNVTLRGDGNLGTEHCRTGDVKAKAIGFYRKGHCKPDMTDGMKWKIYSAVWTRLLPIRRYLLFILHPHIPQRIRNLINK